MDEGIVYEVSDVLAKIIGKKEASRKEAEKLVKEYIKSKDLYKDEEKGEVEKDDLLSQAFTGPLGKYILTRKIREHLTLPTAVDESPTEPQTEIGDTWRENENRNKVKQGAFSVQEDEIIRKKVREIALAHKHSLDDFSWLFNARKLGRSRKEEGLWSSIASALPNRTVRSVYHHGLRLFDDSNKQGRWTEDEDHILKRAHELHGTSWKKVAAMVGRSGEACRSRWKQSITSDRKRVKWTSEEIFKLRSLVDEFLANREAGNGQVGSRDKRDNIKWVAISKEHGTRTAHQCMQKWYKDIQPSMVEEGLWEIEQDQILLEGLFNMYKGKSEWEVDWDALVPGQTGDKCKRRWRVLMTQIPDCAERSFTDRFMFLIIKNFPDFLNT